MARLQQFTLAVVLLAITACGDQGGSPTAAPDAESGPRMAISDARTSGTPGFYFLPPMVPAMAYAGVFDGTQAPVVEICILAPDRTACSGTIVKTFNGGSRSEAITVDAAGESYSATWTKATLALSTGNKPTYYRLSVRVGGIVLGFADLWVANKQNGLKNMPSGFVGVVQNRPLVMKFRIGATLAGDAPSAVADPDYETLANMALNIVAPGVLSNDDLGNPAAAVTSFGGGSLGGTATSNLAGATQVNGGHSLTVYADGSFAYAPAAGFTGVFTFDYRIANSAGSSVATVVIAVSGTPPIAADDAFAVQVGETLNGDLGADNGSGTDIPGTPAATIISFGGGSVSGAVVTNSTTPPANSVALAGGTLTVGAAGAFSLTGTTSTGLVTFMYRLQNTEGSSDATVTINITPAPPPPVGPTAVDDGPVANSAPGAAFHTAFNTALNSVSHATPSLLANDALGSPDAAVVTHFGGGTLGGSVGDNAAGSNKINDGHSLTVNADGSFVYTPKTGFTGNFSFGYVITNAAGSDDGSVTVAVGARPDASNDTYPHTLVGNVPVTTSTGTAYSVLGNDAGDGLTVALVGASATNGDATVNADGTFTFNPAAGFRSGNGTFQYTVTNGFGTSAPATVTIPVGAQVIWFVDNNAGACAASCTGRLSHPFTTLSALHSVNNGAGTNPADNHHIFLYESGTAYVGPLTLRTGQRLIGQDATATLVALTGVTLPPHSTALPAMNSGNVTRTVITSSSFGVIATLDNTVRGLTLGDATTASLGSDLDGFGTLTVADLSIENGSVTPGALTIALNGGPSASTLDGSFLRVTGQRVSLVRINTVGTSVLGTTTDALAGTVGDAVLIDGGTGSFSYAGSISSTGDRPVAIVNKTGGTVTLAGTISGTALGLLVQNNSGGTVVNFSGSGKTLNTGANAAVSLANNTGATVSFNGGGLATTTTTGPGFTAAGGGTVQVTGANNTISSGTGTALSVQHTGIGAAGLTFRSVSHSGGANGIVLVNTGTTSGLQVTGDGSANSGGSITNTVGADGSVAGNGVYLSGASNVNLTRMTLSGHANHGIYGTGVSGISVSNSTVQNNGTNLAGAGEGGIYLRETTGTATLSTLTINNHAFGNGIHLYNSTAGTLNATLTGSTVSNSANDGLLVETHNSPSVTVSISTTNFSANKGDHVQVAPASASVVTATITGGTFSGGHPTALGQGITMRAGGLFSGTFTYDINGITINSSISYAINTGFGSTTGTGLVRGRIRNNTIGTGGVALSGSAQASCILAESNGPGTGTHTVSITNNTIRSCLDRGIELIGNRDGSNHLNATVTGNDINDLNQPFSRHAIHLESGSFALNETGTVCADIANNTLTAVTAVDEIRVRLRSPTTARFPGYTGGTADAGALTTYLQSRNPLGGTASVTITSPATANNTPAGSACPTPP